MAVNSNRRINIFINGKEVEQTIGGVRAAYDELNRSIKQSEFQSEEYWQKADKIKQLKSVIDEHTASLKNVKTGWEKMGDSIKETALGFVGATAIMGAFSKLTGFFKSGVEAAIEYDEQIKKLSFSLHGNSDATREMLDFANEMSKISIFPRSKILEAENMALGLGRTQDQAKKMVTAAMALSRIDPSMDLTKAISFLNGTFGGTTKQIERLVPEIKGLTGVQYASGQAIDIIIEKYGRFATEGLESTRGKMEQFSKSWDILKINMSSFSSGLLDKIVSSFTSLTQSVSDFIEVPVSQKMEEERIEVNSLAFSLQQENLDSGVRNKLYDKLKELSPEILDGIDKENISTSKLTANLAKYNDETIKKIALKSKEEVLQKAGKKYAEAIDYEIECLVNANDLAQKYEQRINDKSTQTQKANLVAEKQMYAQKKITITQYLAWLKKAQPDEYVASGTEINDMKESARLVKEAEENNKKALGDLAVFKKFLGLVDKTEEQKKVEAVKKNNDTLLELKKKSIEDLEKLREDETDVLQKALIVQAINEIKADEKKAKQREKDRETQHKLQLDAMEEGLNKELAKEDERHRKEKAQNKDKHAILEQEEKTHQVNIEKIKKSFEDKRQKYLDETISNGNEISKEKQKYDEELALFYSYVKDKNNLSEKEKSALLVIETNHQTRMDKLDVDAYTKRLNTYDEQYASELYDLKLKQTNELNAITNLEQAKEILHKTWSDKQLIKIKTLTQAKKEIARQNHNEQIALETKQLTDLQAIIDNAKSSGVMSGVVLADNIQSSAELKVLEKAANDLKAKLAALKLIIHETEAEDEQAEKERKAAEFHASQKTDILGYTQSDWDSLKINIGKGKIAVNEVVMAVDVLKNAWSAYSNYLTAAENKRLKQVEASNTKQKTSLQDQLDKGLISQTTYNTKVKALDDDLQKQKDKAAYDQAIREARLAEISVIQNAAVATIALWKSPGFPLAIPLTALVAGMAVASIATIEANLPDAPALAEGGFTDGISVAGEAGTEWVASNKLLKDKKTGPVIKWLENYQRGGKSIPMPIQANFSGIQNAIDNRSSASLSSGNTHSIQNDPEVKGLLVKLIVSHNEGRDEMKLLNKYLSNPENRKARLVRDELTKFDNEIATLQSLAKIA